MYSYDMAEIILQKREKMFPKLCILYNVVDYAWTYLIIFYVIFEVF